MDTATHVLVVILSTFLALFILLSIIVTIQAIRLLTTIQRIAHKAETVIESAENVGTIFKNAAGPLAIMKVIYNMTRVVKGKK